MAIKDGSNREKWVRTAQEIYEKELGIFPAVARIFAEELHDDSELGASAKEEATRDCRHIKEAGK